MNPAEVVVSEIDCQHRSQVLLKGERPGTAKTLYGDFPLTVDNEDNIRIKSGDALVTETDVAIEVLRFFGEQ